MANICEFSVILKCKNKENLQKMCDWFNSCYYYDGDDKECWLGDYDDRKTATPSEHHIGSRIDYSCIKISDEQEDEYYIAMGDGTCAWSGESILTEEPSYKYSIGLANACKLLGVWCQLDTAEYEIGFKEHYVFNEEGEMIEEDYEENICAIDDDALDDFCVYLEENPTEAIKISKTIEFNDEIETEDVDEDFVEELVNILVDAYQNDEDCIENLSEDIQDRIYNIVNGGPF